MKLSFLKIKKEKLTLHYHQDMIITANCGKLLKKIMQELKRFSSKNNGFLRLEIEGDSKIVIDSYNKRISVPCLIKILIKNIWKLSHDLNIYNCYHVYKETNKTTDYLAKKIIDIIDSRNLCSNFLKDVINISFE